MDQPHIEPLTPTGPVKRLDRLIERGGYKCKLVRAGHPVPVFLHSLNCHHWPFIAWDRSRNDADLMARPAEAQGLLSQDTLCSADHSVNRHF
jgi:hypothetical protein